MSLDHYYREKFGNAVQALAIGVGGIHERLLSAMISLITVGKEGFSDSETAEKYNRLFSMMTSKPEEKEGEGTFAATLRQMSDEEARSAARLILEIHSDLFHHQDQL